MYYVIKTKRLKNYLYSLGFNFKQSIDKTGRQKYIFLFKNTNELNIAINFYHNFKKIYMKII
ncbi:DUF5659 domain-containing protein [Clostridium botulinum]|uniref:DUF5659 domain-containing protein n=1 Tax=Clostridium botulinum TaxID=1491 RepID=UPI0033A4D885